MPFPGGVKQRFQAHTWTRPHPREGSCTVEYNWLFCQKPVFKPINLRHQPAAIYRTARAVVANEPSAVVVKKAVKPAS